MVYDPEKITFFAKTDARGENKPFGIKAKDRTKHMYVIGKTGMGKSTMLENMAVQDIQNGEGLAFIDPHGSTAEKLLDYIPEERVNDVLYFAPFDMEHPVSFNIMEDVGPDKRHLVVSGLMSVFEKIWVDAWSARMAYILQNTLMALLEYPESTLLSVNRMLSDKEYRKKVVANVTDPAVKSFWVDEFANYTDRFAAEATPAIQNKIGQFSSNPLIRNTIGQPHSSFDIRQIMDEKKILIINLSKGLVGETNANLLGSMLTTRIYLAAMSRADLPQEKMRDMPNFYFYVDEFQSFANSTFANILSEARKYKLNLTIAHQYIEQMEEEVRNAVFGNVGTIASFRVGPFDAEELEKIFAPRFMATDITNLGFAQIYLTLMIDGIGSPPFSAVTLPPIEPPSTSRKDMVIAASRKQFSKPRSEVESAILKFHESVKDEPKNGQRSSVKRPQESRQEPRREQRPEQRPEVRNGGNTDRQPRGRADEPRPPERRQGRGDDVRPRENRENRDNHQSASRTESTGGEERKQRNHRNTPRKANNLDELRSVLRSISSMETDTETTVASKNTQREHVPERSAPKKPMSSVEQRQPRQREHAVPSGGLKSAVADLLKNSPEREAPREQMSEPPANPAPQKAKDDISPKELERMMRVTTGDRPPH